MQKQKFNVTGMTCAACQSHVEKAVSKLDGVKTANVNLLLNNMLVEYDEKKLNEKNICDAVVKAGYGAYIEEKNPGEKKKTSEEKAIDSMKKRLIISLCFLLPLMYVAMHHMLHLPIPSFVHGTQNALKHCLLQLVLLLPILVVNHSYFINGFKRLLKLSPNMDSLIALGSMASILYGVFAMIEISSGLKTGDMALVDRYRMDVYFESAGMILTLVTLGKFFETKSKGKTHDAIQKLMDLSPQTAIVLKENQEVEIKVEEIQKEDILLIKPGFKIPVDGVVTEGASWVDQASITGESVPVSKTVGDSVISGTVNQTGSFKMQATKVGEDTTLSQIIKVVEEASSSKAPIAKLADKVAGVFVPIVIFISIITFIIWIGVGQSFEFALGMAISVLVIACPCALGLATPVAIMVGTGKASENGILIKSAESLETLHQIDTVVLDKTGTITEGKPVVTDIESKTSEKELLQIAASLEQKSEHPLAKAILEKAKEENAETLEATAFESIPGKGVTATIQNEKYFAGNRALMEEYKINLKDVQDQAFLKSGKTVIYFAKEKEFLGVIAVADTLKNTSTKAIDALKKHHLEVVMLTGDNEVVAKAIAKEIGIEKVIAEVLPQDKEKEVKKLQEEGRKVLFVGDGINDSPALARANVGMAIGNGTDIAIDSADVVLMNQNMFAIPTAIELSKKVIANIKMNLFWAFFYNSIGIPIAAGVFYKAFGLKLNPMIGAAAMSMSSVCVVTNALRLRKFKSTVGSDALVAPNQKEENQMSEYVKTIGIEGMMCEHCKKHVTEALSQIDGVTSVEVSLENKNAIINATTDISSDVIEKAVKDAGYEMKSIQ